MSKKKSKKLFDERWTKKQERKENRKRIKMLLASDNEEAFALAYKLKACAKRSPCKSPACAVCNHEESEIWIKNLLRFLKKKRTIHFLTLAPNALFINPRGLRQVSAKLIKSSLAKRIERSNLRKALVAGGIEAVYKEESNKISVHLHLIFANCTKSEIEAFCLHYYKFKKGGARQYRCDEIKDGDRPRTFSYCHKHRTYFKKKGFRKPFRPPPEIEIAHLLFLDRHTFKDLLFFKGIRQSRKGMRRAPKAKK
jgi:hypothetical protein